MDCVFDGKDISTGEGGTSIISDGSIKVAWPSPKLFFQQFWSEVGKDVTTTVLKFLNLNGYMEMFNKTLISLIPKVKNTDRITNYRPISLCNRVYKIAAKVLLNRLMKRVLPHLIAVNQSAFVSQRLITDNIIVAFEVLHSLRTKRRGKRVV